MPRGAEAGNTKNMKKKQPSAAERKAQFNARLLTKVVEVLKENPEGVKASDVAQKVGCQAKDLYVWWANFGQHVPGIIKQKASKFVWSQTAADANETSRSL